MKNPLCVFKRSRAFTVVLIALGAVLFLGGILLVLLERSDRYTMFYGFLTGLGLCWLVIGCIRHWRIKRNPAIVLEEEIDQKDERHQAIRSRAGYYTFLLWFVLLFVSIIALVFLSYKTASLVLCGVLVLMAVTFLLFYALLQKRM